MLRGLVMVVMALDHTRDFFHQGAMQGKDPLDLADPSTVLFFTRWITHFCAPVFVFLAGTGAFLSSTRGRSTGDLSRFLLTRGLWLVFLELTWVHWLGWSFAINLHEHLLIVIWAIGWSMVCLSALVHLPPRIILGVGLVMVLGHNALDGVKPESWGSMAWLWQVLHAGGPVRFGFAPDYVFKAGYPLIPWVGVMALGYAFGELLRRPPPERQRRLVQLGLLLTGSFVLLRVTNLYGDLRPWTTQRTPWLTFLSLLDCHKYPPSLCYLLMTLGPAMLVLAWLDRAPSAPRRLLLPFGRVPLFYYLLHLPLIHALAVLAALLTQGRADWLYGTQPTNPPPGAGFGLGVTYAVWIFVVLMLYPACRWFADLKRRRKEPWLSYL